MEKESLTKLNRYVNKAAYTIFDRANSRCGSLIEGATRVVDDCLCRSRIPADQVCVVAVGSLGRNEALTASDIDLIPIIASQECLERFPECDALIRREVKDQLGVKVSKGEALTKADCIQNFAAAHLIGTEMDGVTALTKRILVLTEAVRIGGAWEISEVQQAILDGYSGKERTRGRHVLSLINDIARYFRTLCVEYKGKVDGEEKDWCTRNVKLRYSRKFWYFANLIALVSTAEEHPRGERTYDSELLRIFATPPYMRILEKLGEEHSTEVGRLLESYSVFLEFMECPERRAALAAVEHDSRYAVNIQNPFPALKYNSDLMHSYMVDILNGMNLSARRRVIDWFLL